MWDDCDILADNALSVCGMLDTNKNKKGVA